jgi:hypothetical protein
MTINVCVKVNEGVVLASDSTTTLSDANGAWANSYDHANKMLCLRKGLPIGMQTCGLGNIGANSIASLGKEFRRRITSEGEHHVDPRNYSMEQVSNAFGSFLKERYDKAFSDPTPHRC